jgi:very-short-patch-repair endonuclease
MRGAPTDAENRLWQILRAKRLSGYKFRRQLPIDSFIADFACLQHRSIIEVDGSQHGPEADAGRDAYLRSQGFHVLHFWNNDIFNNEEGVIERILGLLDSPSPQALSRRGERG